MVSKSLIFLSYILGTRSVAGHTRRTGLAIARLIRILMSSPGGPNQEVRFFLGLGTRAVRPTPERPGASLGYNDEISRVCLCAANSGPMLGPAVKTNSSVLYPTKGPENRYKNVLFIEKEGFDPLLKASQIAERLDVAIMSTKGMSVSASRLLL